MQQLECTTTRRCTLQRQVTAIDSFNNETASLLGSTTYLPAEQTKSDTVTRSKVWTFTGDGAQTSELNQSNLQTARAREALKHPLNSAASRELGGRRVTFDFLRAAQRRRTLWLFAIEHIGHCGKLCVNRVRDKRAYLYFSAYYMHYHAPTAPKCPVDLRVQ
eukprot:6198606-Pleurochrysis_carterae.AAC.1